MRKFEKTIVKALFILVAAVFFAGCLKDDVDESPYTAANEALLIGKWRAQMKSQNVAFDSTATKIYYFMDKTNVGTGPKVAAGDSVTVAYEGVFLDGTLFDYSTGITYVHKASDSRMISGWEESIEMLSKGGIGYFLVPSNLAYGSNGFYAIPPYTPLFFTIRILDIK
jgi:FKBP-type peptidyl-prolyl cis-trans isomerase